MKWNLLFQDLTTRALAISIIHDINPISIPTQRYIQKINITYFIGYRITLSTTYHPSRSKLRAAAHVVNEEYESNYH